MFVADCEEWAAVGFPNLDPQYYTEYVLMLAEFAPDATMERVPLRAISNWRFCFPFVDIDETFNHSAFEEHAEMVERDLASRYNFDIEDFAL